MEYLSIFTAVLLNSLVCAIIACVYRHVLAYEKILSWWFQWGLRKHIDRWYYYPIWGCEKCLAGQLSLWTYLIFSVMHAFRPDTAFYSLFSYNPLFHVFGSVLGVLFAIIITKLFKHL